MSFSFSFFAVPPVAIIFTPLFCKKRANDTIPALSDTEISAVFGIILFDKTITPLEAEDLFCLQACLYRQALREPKPEAQ